MKKKILLALVVCITASLSACSETKQTILEKTNSVENEEINQIVGDENDSDSECQEKELSDIIMKDNVSDEVQEPAKYVDIDLEGVSARQLFYVCI